MGQKPTTKCDIYSLGIVMWQMKSGKIPYSDVNNKDILIYKVIIKPLLNS